MVKAKAPKKMDWLKFFGKTICRVQENLSVVLEAPGCREGWLQGEFYLAGRKHGLRVNTPRLLAAGFVDLSCDDPPMIAEIKILGPLDPKKMRTRLESDVDRLKAAKGARLEKYMILVVPNHDKETAMWKYLRDCKFSKFCTQLK